MAQMIPATISEQTQSHGEKEIYYCLKEALSDDVIVFHSYDIISKNAKNKFIDGEIDFLILFPDMGILVLEVKGGIVAYDGARRTWIQNGHDLGMSPYKQAESYKYKVRNYLLNKNCCNSSLQFGHCVSFPDVYEQITKLTADADREITITGQQLNYIDKVTHSIMLHFIEDETKNTLSPSQILNVKMALAPVFEYGTSVCSSINIEDKKIFSLTEEQCRLLNFLGERKRVLIEGCAGSGKTIMAIKKAQQFAQQNKKVLFLAFNKMITQQIRRALIGYENRIEVSTYHAFCVNMLANAGQPVDFSKQNGYGFWEEEIPKRFSELITYYPIKYDAVIVDEGQDFLVEYWCTIDGLLRPDSYLYIFYDPRQNIYAPDMIFPIDELPFKLTENCRNTKSIFNSIIQHVPKNSMTVLSESPEGKPVIELCAASPQEQRHNLSQILHKLLIEEKLPKEKIVILGGHNFNNTSLADNPAVGNYVVCEKENDCPNSIQYYTYLFYKGCEADVVILLDVDANDERWNNPHALYTAKSRAKHLLYILKIQYTHSSNEKK